MITEGTRAARNKGGRNIRVPADMRYDDWKKVYIDRTLTLEGWQNQRERGKIKSPQIVPFKTAEYANVAKPRNIEEIVKAGERFKPLVEQYTGRTSKWTGEIVLANGDKVKGGKMWNCGILINSDAPDHVLIHELIHSSSISYFNKTVYADNAMAEELAVHFLSQELALKENVPLVRSAYDEGVELIREYKKALKLPVDDLEFASALIKCSPNARWEWLDDLANGIDLSSVTIEERRDLTERLEAIMKWQPNSK